MSKYQDQYNRDIELIARRKALFLKYFTYWKPQIQRVLIQTNLPKEEKVQILLNSVVARQIVTSLGKTTKDLKNALTKYIETPNDEILIERITSLTESGVEAIELEKARRPLTSVIPKDIIGFLPTKLVVDVDPTGEITDIYTRFANKDKNLGIKIEKQKAFIKVKNNFERLLSVGIRAQDPGVRMMTLLIYIMYDTGIRPGEVGEGTSTLKHKYLGPVQKVDNKNLPLPKPEEEVVGTFGAISLEPQHFKVIDGITNLEFYGKSGMVNTAYISKPELNYVIRDILKNVALHKTQGPLFVIDGKPYTRPQINAFYIELLKDAGMPKTEVTGHTLTDMRKLKSATVLHETLLENQSVLDMELLKIEDIYSENAEKEIQKAIVGYLKKAVEQSEIALNHADMDMTINSYINPQVLLNFFQRSGDVTDSFSELINTGGKLEFNLQKFVLQASNRIYNKFVDNSGWGGMMETEEGYGVRSNPLNIPERLKYAKLNKKVIVVDRIEGKQAVCRFGRSTFILPVSALPVGVREGMGLEISLKPVNTKLVRNKLKQIAQRDDGKDFSI